MSRRNVYNINDVVSEAAYRAKRSLWKRFNVNVHNVSKSYIVYVLVTTKRALR